jgi:hypothetical protein
MALDDPPISGPASLFFGGSLFGRGAEFFLDAWPKRAESANHETHKRPDEKTLEAVKDDSVAARAEDLHEVFWRANRVPGQSP